ncbi:MAG: hypothetical protein ABI346_05010, partial [Candidatus Baltobacteraceae bacterium]
MIRAVISLGTNSTRLLVIRDLPGGQAEQLEHRSIGTRLGEGLLERGALGEHAMRRTLDAIGTFVERARAHEASVEVIATSAMRRANNADAFAARVEGLCGAPLSILSGDEEAASSFAGATYAQNVALGRLAVLDVGGGSTECAVGRAQTLERSLSIEIGAVRLAERFPRLLGTARPEEAIEEAAAARSFAREVLRPLRTLPPAAEVRAVAGTPLTLGAIVASTDIDRVRGRVLTRVE